MTRFVKTWLGIGILTCAVFLMCVMRGYLQPGAPIINGERHIVIVIPSYNNSKWYQANLDSVFKQRYSNYHVMYIDDCSPDGTGELVLQYVKKHNKQDLVTVVKNPQRRGALYNLYHAIHACDDRTIIITLDGDDWLKDEWVLSVINEAYRDPSVVLTYGQFEEYPQGSKGFCVPLPDYMIKSACYRKERWLTSHLRTFYAGLFKKIKQDDLMYGGEFFNVTWDQAFMFPMLEMANGKIKCIERVLYVYNQNNPLNDFRVRLQQQLMCERIIRRKEAYQPLSDQELHSFIAA